MSDHTERFIPFVGGKKDGEEFVVVGNDIPPLLTYQSTPVGTPYHLIRYGHYAYDHGLAQYTYAGETP